MSTIMLLSTAFGLAMDAFAVSICNGLCFPDLPLGKNALSSGLTFGIFQGMMTLVGFLAGSLFRHVVESIDHWIALILLCLIGGKMLYDGYQEMKNPEDCCVADFSFRTLLLQGVATSIDALAVGISLAVIQSNILTTCAVIALVSFALSFIGVHIGRKFGHVLSDKAQLVGGALLIFIGVKIFYDHTVLGG